MHLHPAQSDPLLMLIRELVRSPNPFQEQLTPEPCALEPVWIPTWVTWLLSFLIRLFSVRGYCASLGVRVILKNHNCGWRCSSLCSGLCWVCDRWSISNSPKERKPWLSSSAGSSQLEDQTQTGLLRIWRNWLHYLQKQILCSCFVDVWLYIPS